MKESDAEFQARIRKIIRRGLMMSDQLLIDECMIEIEWHNYYAIVPRKTVSGKWVWLTNIYRRKVWRRTDMTTVKPFNEYGTVFDVVKE